jgi:hypothetical protein
MLLSECYNDSVSVEVRLVAVDDGSAVERGFVANVTITNAGAAETTVAAAVSLDFVGALAVTNGTVTGFGGRVNVLTLTDPASGRTMLCGYQPPSSTPPTTTSMSKSTLEPVVAPAQGHGAADPKESATTGLVPLFLPPPPVSSNSGGNHVGGGSGGDNGGAWSTTSSLTAPYSGQGEVPGGGGVPLTYRLAIQGVTLSKTQPASKSPPSKPPAAVAAAGGDSSVSGSNSSGFYVGIGLAGAGANLGKSSFSVEGAPQNPYLLDGAASAVPTVHYIPAADTDNDGIVAVTVLANGHVEGLWLYGRSEETDPAAAAAVGGGGAASAAFCDPITGRVTGKQGQDNICPQITPCSQTAAGQKIDFGLKHPDVGQRTGGADLSFVTKGKRSWFNLVEFSATTCQTENGPMVVFDSFVCPTWCECRNEFWKLTSAGQLISNLTGQCVGSNTTTVPPVAATANPDGAKDSSSVDASGSGITFASMVPCETPVPLEQHWTAVAAYAASGGATNIPKQLRNGAGGCLDGSPPRPPPPPPSPPSPPPSDLGKEISFIDCGSGSDLAFGIPHFQFQTTLAAGDAASFMLHLPSFEMATNNSSTSSTSSTSSGSAASTASKSPLRPHVSVDGDSQCATNPAALAAVTKDTWASRLHGAASMFQIADPRAMRAVSLAVQQLVMMTERQHDGLRCLKGMIHYYGSDPYDTYRITTAFQQLGMLNLSRAVLERQLSQRCTNGMWQMWETPSPPSNPGLYIVQGLASTAIYNHYLTTRDPEWLATAWPAINGTAFATVASRAACNCAGLMPVGGGDGGIATGHVYVQEAGPLFGLLAAQQMATLLGHNNTAARLATEFAEFKTALLASIDADLLSVDGYSPVIPLLAGQKAAQYESANWGAVDTIHPFPLIAANDSKAVASMALWSSPARTDTYGLHLKQGYSTKPWAYLSADLGHIHLQQGNFSGASRVWNAMLNNSSPAVSTFEEFETGPMPKTMWGGIPDMWFTAEVVNLFRDLLVLENIEDASLRLLHGASESWRAGVDGVLGGIRINNAPTRFGCNVTLKSEVAAAAVTPRKAPAGHASVSISLDVKCGGRRGAAASGRAFASGGGGVAETPRTIEVHLGAGLECNPSAPPTIRDGGAHGATLGTNSATRTRTHAHVECAQGGITILKLSKTPFTTTDDDNYDAAGSLDWPALQLVVVA